MGSAYDGSNSYSYSFTLIQPTLKDVCEALNQNGSRKLPLFRVLARVWVYFSNSLFTFSSALNTQTQFPKTNRVASSHDQGVSKLYIITRGWLLQFSVRTQNSIVCLTLFSHFLII